MFLALLVSNALFFNLVGTWLAGKAVSQRVTAGCTTNPACCRRRQHLVAR